MPKSPPTPISSTNAVEKRHTVSIWFILLGVVAFLGGCVLLYMEDGSDVRQTLPPLKPRAEAPSHRGIVAVMPAVERATQVSVATPAAFPPGFVDGLWPAADAAGVSRLTFNHAFAVAHGPDNSVLALNASQPEFDRTVGDYVTSIVNSERIAVGRARLALQAKVLAEIERRYGVDRHIVMAIWGIESNYGAAMGDRSVIRSLATLASAELGRAAAWRAELIAALTMLERDKIAPEKLVGSWAGAMGHTQLMPSAFLKSAVDFDGIGKRDIWASPSDALASAAHFLKSAGWVADRPWGHEVVLPANFDYALASRGAARSLRAWNKLGVDARLNSPSLDETASWRLIVPAGAGGPAFLVSQNFDALLAYNPSDAYALAVGILADRIAGGGPIRTVWPDGDVAMSRVQRAELQQILQSLGFDPGRVDGIIGAKTREAIRGYQKAHAMPADGHQSLVLLKQMHFGRWL